MTILRKIFSPPVFEDELKTQQAYLLNVILWVLVSVPIPFVLYSFFIVPENLSRALVQAAFGETVNIFLLVILRRGYVRAAAFIQVGAFWFFFTVTAWTSTGVQSEAYLLGYGLVIAIAGMLLGGWGALAMSIFSLAAGGGMAYAQTQGWLDGGTVSTPLTTWIVSLILFPVTATLQYLGGRMTRAALDRARSSEERYRLISEVSSDYTFSTELDPQGGMRLNWVAGAFERMTGYTLEGYIAAGGWLAQLFPEDAESDYAALKKLARNQPAISEVRTYKKNREIVWVRVYAQPVWDSREHRLVGIVGGVQDITEQKRIEDAVRRSEAIYRKAIEVAGAVPYHQTFDERGAIHYDFMGEGIREITGYGPEEFTDELWGTLIVERHLLEDLEPYTLDEAIERVRTNKNPIWKCEHCIRARDGSIRWVFEAAVDLRDERGIAYGSIGMYQDITTRKLSEDMLKYERDLLQIFLDNIPDTVYFKDQESRFVRINAAQARFLGIPSAEDAIGKSDLDYMPAALAKSFLEEEQRIIQTGEPVINRIEFNPTQDGQLRWLSATKVPVRDAEGKITGIIGISRNVTEQKLAQEYEQNRRATLEKVLTLGQEVTEVKDLLTTLQKIWHGVHQDLNFDRTGIYLYNPASNSMEGTYGTSRQGKMIEEWGARIFLDHDTPESRSFIHVLKESDGLYFTHDYAANHDTQAEHIMDSVKDFAAVAARVGDKPVAVICVDNVISGRPIANEQLEALRLFAGYAGLAIENSRLNGTLQVELQQQKQSEEREVNRRVILEKVVQLGKLVTEVTDLQTVLTRIWHGVRDEMGFDRLAIFLYDRATHSIRGTFGTDNHGDIVEEWEYERPLKQDKPTSFVRALESPDGVFFTHSFAHEFDIPEGHKMHGVTDFAAVTAWGGSEPVAIITVDNLLSNRPFSRETLEALRLFAGYAGLAIQNVRLNEALQVELHQQKRSEEREARRRSMLEKVVELGKQVTETANFITTLQRIWHGVHDNLNFDRVGIFLYNREQNSMDGTFGTSRQGEMTEEWGLHFSLDNEDIETFSFINVITEENGLYSTRNYAADRNLPEGHTMEGVQHYAAVAAWAGDQPMGVICVDNLITARAFTDEQLEALRLFAGYAGLAIQNARLNAALEQDLAHRQSLIEELETKNAELERFTYTVSHDLKSPLVTITGFLGYVEKDALAGNTEKVKSSIVRIQNAAQKMQKLLNDLLELSRVGRLMNQPENLPFTEIAREALDQVRGRLEANRIRIEMADALPVVHGDRIRLVEVMQNLVDNAAKFSRNAPDPLITIGWNGNTEKGFPIFFVRDNGIGIAPQYPEKVFGLFDKLDPTAEGTGVGLTLVKRIIEVHGGKIWIESQPGSGATFYFSLPGETQEN